MQNKLAIVTFLLLLSFGAAAQTGAGSTVATEGPFYNQNLNPDNKIELFPNPAVDYLIVQISNSTLQNTEFELHSIIGNEMKIIPEDLGGGRYRIPVKEFATGYYFLVVKDETLRFKKAYKFLKN